MSLQQLNEMPNGTAPSDGSGKAYLEVQKSGSSRMLTLSLNGERHLIGRNPSLPIPLDDESVSRLHAALVLDPFGRWWIHDLGSTNGTYVNGTAVTRRLLNPADTIKIGAYSLAIRTMSDLVERRPATLPPPHATNQQPIDFKTTTRIRGVTASSLSVAIAQDAIAQARSMLRFEERAARLRALCDYAVSERFLGLWTAVFRVDRHTGPRLTVGPMTRASFGNAFPDLERGVEALCVEHRERFFQDAGPHVFDSPTGAKELLVACVLDGSESSAEVLFIQYSRTRESTEWPSVVALMGESFRLADKLWEGRRQSCVNAAIERELEMARRLQDSLVPQAYVPVSGLELAIGYEPSQWVGGDYADVVRMRDGRTLLVVADVCGKGLQASLVASSLHTLVHVLVDSASGLPDLANRINAHLCRYLPEHSFVTMVLVAIDATSRNLECVNLGHPPPLLIKPDGTVRQLQSAQNVGLGMTDLKARSDRSAISPDEILLLYTDGLCAPEESDRAPSESRVLRDCTRVIASMAESDLATIGERLAKFVTIRRESVEGAGDDVAFWLARLAQDNKDPVPKGNFRRVSSFPPPIKGWLRQP